MPACLQPGNQTFRLPHVQTFLDDAFGGVRLAFVIRQTKNHLRMANGNPSITQQRLHRRRQFQQARRVRHRRAALADLGGDFLLRELKLSAELRVAERFFQRIQILALQVFDERQFQHGAVIGFAIDDGNFGKIQQLRRAPAAFAGDEFKKSAAFAHNERLDDALLADGIGEFLQRFRGKIFPRLQRRRTNAVQWHALNLFAIVRRGSRRSDRRSR